MTKFKRAHVASWAVLAVVLVGALAVGATGDGAPATDAERAHRIASEVRCPTCRSQSAADSDAAAAVAIREDILRRVRDGQSDGDIRVFLVSRYGEDILLNPSKRGVSTAVWVLPVLAVGAAIAGLALAFRRWKPRRRRASEGDRALVDEALKT